MKYHEQIKHPLWQKKRLEVLQTNRFKCQSCGSTEEELHVHHPYYKRGAMIWEYVVEELECLCHKCHKDAHAIDDAIRKGLALLDSESRLQVRGYIDSIIGPIMHSTDENYEQGYADGMRGNTGWIISAHRSEWGE